MVEISKRKLKKLVDLINNNQVGVSVPLTNTRVPCAKAAITIDNRVIFFDISKKDVVAYPICFDALDGSDLRIINYTEFGLKEKFIDNVVKGRK